jgi:hypothetical protein
MVSAEDLKGGGCCLNEVLFWWKTSVTTATGLARIQNWAHHKHNYRMLSLHHPRSSAGIYEKQTVLLSCSKHATFHSVSAPRVQPSRTLGGLQEVISSKTMSTHVSWQDEEALLNQYPSFTSNINILNLNTQSRTSITLKANCENVHLFPRTLTVFKIILCLNFQWSYVMPQSLKRISQHKKKL